MQPLPTPFDIAPIPYFAYVPGPLAWGVCAIVAVLIYFLVRRFSVVQQSQEQVNALSLFEQQFQSLRNRPKERPLAEQLARLTRTLLATIDDPRWLSLSANELKRLVQMPKTAVNPALKERFAQTLQTLESLSYRPPALIEEELSTLMSELQATLQALQEARTAAHASGAAQ